MSGKDVHIAIAVHVANVDDESIGVTCALTAIQKMPRSIIQPYLANDVIVYESVQVAIAVYVGQVCEASVAVAQVLPTACETPGAVIQPDPVRLRHLAPTVCEECIQVAISIQICQGHGPASGL